MSNFFTQSASTPSILRSVSAIGQDVWEMLREVDNSFLIRKFIAYVEPRLSPRSQAPRLGLDQAQEIFAKMDLHTYTQGRDKLTDAIRTRSQTLADLRGKWESDGHRKIIRMMVDLFSAHTPRTQLFDEYRWIPTYGAVVGIQDNALHARQPGVDQL